MEYFLKIVRVRLHELTRSWCAGYPGDREGVLFGCQSRKSKVVDASKLRSR